MKAVVLKDRCSGCGPCVELCPEVFEFGDDGLAQVKVDVVPPEAEATCREAAANCPTDAIQIEA